MREDLLTYFEDFRLFAANRGIFVNYDSVQVHGYLRGLYLSIMDSGILGRESAYSTATHASYLDELFGGL